MAPRRTKTPDVPPRMTRLVLGAYVIAIKALLVALYCLLDRPDVHELAALALP